MSLFQGVLRGVVPQCTRSSRSYLQTCASRGIATSSPFDAPRLRVTLIQGDGIGPELCSSVVGAFSAAKVPIDWSIQPPSSSIDNVLMSIARNQVCLKGPLSTSIGKSGGVSRNHMIRDALNLFANVVHIKSKEGIPTRHKNIDFVIIRENTEGEYIGYEQEVVRGVVQSFKTITRVRSVRIARYAFEFAQRQGRKKVTAVHKANIQKVSDGEFLKACRDVAKEFPDIQYNEMIVDNTSMQLVMNPHQFDVMVTPNLYGTIVTNIGMGLVGGPGVVPSANFGSRGDAVFEPGGRHVGMDIAGKDVANPIGMLETSVNMLRHVGGYDGYADLIGRSVEKVVSDGKNLTRDLGGTVGTKAFTQAVIEQITEYRERERA